MLPESDWSFRDTFGGEVYTVLNAIERFTGKWPSTLGLCEPEDDLPMIIAYIERQNAIAAYENKLQREEAEKKSKKHNR